MTTLPSKEKLESIVRSVIVKNEKLGEEAGGSGHLAYTSYKLKKIEPLEEININSQKAWKVKFQYSIFIETEFTYYPDNPPQEYEYCMVINLDCNGNVIFEGNRECVNAIGFTPM